MTRQWLTASILVALAGLGLDPAIASQPQTRQAQVGKPSLCRQYGAEYQELYTVQVDNLQSVTVCQKGKQYFYVRTIKPQISSVDLSHPASLSDTERKE